MIEERNGGNFSAVVPESATSRETSWRRRSPETPSPDAFGTPFAPDEPERAVSLVERRACESPDAVSAVVDVAETGCGWWLLADLVATGTVLHGGSGGDETTASVRDGTVPSSDRPLVESVARAAGQSPERAFEALHTDLLPKLLVSGLVEHADAVGGRSERAAVELRSEADREFVSAVLLLTAGAVELTSEAGGAGETGDADEALRESVERFETVVRRVRTSSQRASRICERNPTRR